MIHLLRCIHLLYHQTHAVKKKKMQNRIITQETIHKDQNKKKEIDKVGEEQLTR